MLSIKLNRGRMALGACALAVACVTAGTTASAASAHPQGAASVRITSVTFSGSPASPTVTITGSGFGRKAPKGASASTAPGCGGLVGPGLDYGNSLWFIDDTVPFTAGQGKPPTNGSCVGVVVNSWSDTSVSLSFGVWYGQNDWVANPGDNFVWTIKGYPFGGLISYSG
jgi:hypothetical protein